MSVYSILIKFLYLFTRRSKIAFICRIIIAIRIKV